MARAWGRIQRRWTARLGPRFPIEPGPGRVLASSFTLAGDLDGLHALSYFAEDIGANREPPRFSTVAVDNTAPVSELSVGLSSFTAADLKIYVSSRTLLSFVSVDPSSGGVASGVEFIHSRIDGGTFTVFLASFTLAEGVHGLEFQSEDRLGNLELLKGATVLADATPPTVGFRIEGSSFTDSLGRLVISTSSLVVLEALDPVSAGVASGAERLRFRLNGADYQSITASSISFSLSEGNYSVAFDAQDRVGNVSATVSFEVLVDSTGPSLDEARGSSAGQNKIRPGAEFVSALSVDARIRAQELASGL